MLESIYTMYEYKIYIVIENTPNDNEDGDIFRLNPTGFTYELCNIYKKKLTKYK